MKSMTGFGKAVKEFENKTITVEIRSLNSKQMDLNLRLPSSYKSKELDLRSSLTKELERGKIDVSIYLDYRKQEPDIEIDSELALVYAEKLKAIADHIEAPKNSLLDLVLKMPEVIKNQRKEADEGEWEQINTAIQSCIIEINEFRGREGLLLMEDMKTRLKKILIGLAQISILDENRIQHIRARINKNLTDFFGEHAIDKNRFEQELIYYLEKLDINEEKVRLKLHCEHFLKILNEESSGRKINFISQEIGREINTIGSKANDAEIQKIVVEMKDELEKIKEQSMNIL